MSGTASLQLLRKDRRGSGIDHQPHRGKGSLMLQKMKNILVVGPKKITSRSSMSFTRKGIVHLQDIPIPINDPVFSPMEIGKSEEISA